MDDERKGNPWIAWCGGIVVLLGLYVGAYAFTVGEREEVEAAGGWGYMSIVVPSYRVGPARFAEPFFSPIHWIDRKIRRQKWAPRGAGAGAP